MKDTAKAMAKRLITDSIWKSANLEGLGTTFPKTEVILENIPTETTTEEVLFIVSMKRAWNFILSTLGYENNIFYLREINKKVMEVLIENAGEIIFPDIDEIVDTIRELNSIKDVELKALKYFCFVVRTQMFADGNKRVAQLIANKILIDNEVGIFQIPIEQIETFKSLLIAFYETNDDSTLIDFMRKHCVQRVRN